MTRTIAAGALFLLLAIISIGDAVFWKNIDGIWINAAKSIVAAVLVGFLIRGSAVSKWIVVVWSILGSLGMALVSFQMAPRDISNTGISKTFLMMALVASGAAYLVVALLLLTGSRQANKTEISSQITPRVD